jgi:cell pole-organizing protein PopZ
MSEPEAAQEPTMEEILASIRRIISEDENSRETAETQHATEDVAEETAAEAENAYEAPAQEWGHDTAADMPEEAPVRETYAAYEAPEARDRDWANERETSNPNEEQYASVGQVFTGGDDNDYEDFEDEDDTVVDFEPESHEVNFEAATEEDAVAFQEFDEPGSEQETVAEVEESVVAFEPQSAELETADVFGQEGGFESAAREAVEEQVLSAETEAQVASLMGQLSQVGDAASDDGDPAISVEEVVRDMVRPMLQTWLDDNLPTLVEQIVEREIKRVMRAR